MQLYDESHQKSSLKNEIYNKITSIYMQLDFVGVHKDKLTHKNGYNNLFNDALHCFYAAHCDIFLTNDKKS